MGANAQIEVPAFTAGQVLTAAEMTQVNTGIPVFATTVTRDAAFGGAGEKVLAEGQFAYIEATNTTQYYDGAAWQSVGVTGIVQAKSTTKTDTFTTSSTTLVDITGFSVSITPTSASNKILILVNINLGSEGPVVRGTLLRDATEIGIGDAAGNRTRVSFADFVNQAGTQIQSSVSFLDSPATTSATTYKLQIMAGSAGTIAVNRAFDNSDITARSMTISTITVFEVTV
jgi:hypothetical protein